MTRARREASARPLSLVRRTFGLVQNDYVRELIRDGFLGEIREVVVIGATDVFSKPEAPLHWRQDAEISGDNVLSMGILHETLLRWAPPPTRVAAFAASMRTSSSFEPRPIAASRSTTWISGKAANRRSSQALPAATQAAGNRFSQECEFPNVFITCQVIPHRTDCYPQPPQNPSAGM